MNGRTLDRRRTGRILLLAVPLLALLLLYFAPIANLVLLGGDPTAVTRAISTPVHWEILGNTFLFAAKVTALTLLFAYPIAAFAATARPRVAAIILLCSTIPLWTSLLARTYAWMVILERRGIVNSLLLDLGLLDRPANLVHNSFGAISGSVYIMLPLMVLSLSASMSTIDGTLVRAARTLGASPVAAFLRVYLPMSLPGVIAGSLLVFILSLAFFVTPSLLGGPSDRVFSTLIAQQVSRSVDFSMASALSIMFLIATMVVLAVVGLTVGFEQVLGGRGSHHVRLSRGFGAHAMRIVAPVLPLFGWMQWRRTWAVVVGLCLFVLIAPYAILFILSVSNREYLALPDGAVSLRWYQTVLTEPRWVGAIVTSLIVGAVAAVVAVVLGLSAAVGLRSASSRWGRILLVLFITPAVLPTMIYSIAAYFGAARVGLIDSHVGLILAHTMLAVPLVVIVCGTALGNLGKSVERAASSLGATPTTTFRRVTLPLIMPGVLTALVIAFQTSFDEIVVSLFLSGVTTRTLPKALWQASTLEVTPIIPAVAVVLVGIILAAGACMMLLSRVAFGFRAHIISGRGVA